MREKDTSTANEMFQLFGGPITARNFKNDNILDMVATRNIQRWQKIISSYEYTYSFKALS